MSAPAEAVELRRAVWRQEYGYLSRERVRQEWLGEEYRRALDEYEGLGGDRATVRRHEPALPGAYEDALRAARRVLDGEGPLRLALAHLLRARAGMARMRDVLDANSAIRRAAEPVERLRAAARVPRLRALPCVDAPGRLLRAAHARMAEGAHARAAYLARAARGQAEALAPAETTDADRVVALETAFRNLRALCAATRGLLADPSADLLSDGTLEAADALVADGELALAERVAEELEAQLAPRSRFRQALEAEGEEAEVVLHSLRARLAARPPAGEPWSAATRMLWQSRVELGVRRVRAEQYAPDAFASGRADEDEEPFMTNSSSTG
ncbi:hypothetical protein [Longimicrobium terrae]|uniref:Uncharacterized protein n=1 Tax=Longimicrobium terrae TaxID=1639882 RepID=A0A841H3E9_9BACT|nr:hypothetical protein [Longimicrobium terrae]MBB4638131.1 hypothetical protein [Longimicrobium terrae]MBB6072503.1 hypothetical protein [Longimicrobium terrae]NNC32087.1 hypothetical protein [Longimicrobium terrae]